MDEIRILVVDDESPTRNFIVDGLGALGITDRAVGVASAEDALAAAAEATPDLVISDIRMTGLNGLDLARFLRQNHPNTKVILITGYSTRDIEKAATALSVDALIRKPFGLDALGDAVRTALNRPRLAADEHGLPAAKFEALTRQIDILKRDIGAQWIGLLDDRGQPVIQAGASDELADLLQHLTTRGWATTLAATAEDIGSYFLYIEGQPHDIYFTSVDRSYSLVFIYDRRWQTNRVGAVWLTAKHSVQELARLLSNQSAPSPPHPAFANIALTAYAG
ncbi:MAG: response regulator [Chloroflexi bacterium]|nr:response regulator [Chloroflexota bacterium]